MRRLLPRLRQVAGEGRRVTVCFDRGGWSPALFADITAAGFDLLTWRKGPAPDLPAEEFTTVACTDDRGRAHECDLASTTVELGISEGPRKGQTVTLRQVTRQVPARHGAIRQIHVLTSRTDLRAGEVCWRLTSRWREENYFRYARTRTSPSTPSTPTPPPPTTRTGWCPTRLRRPRPPASGRPKPPSPAAPGRDLERGTGGAWSRGRASRSGRSAPRAGQLPDRPRRLALLLVGAGQQQPGRL